MGSFNHGCEVVKSFRRCIERFLPEERGAVLVEALLIFPVITIFTAGILEFGNILWQRQQLQVGVRDAARYYARCRTEFNACSIEIARNVGIYGVPFPDANTPSRVPGWADSGELTVSGPIPTATFDVSIIVVEGTNSYEPSPWFAALGINTIELSYTHQQRFIGW